MSRSLVKIVRTKDGKLKVDIEAPARECDSAHEKMLAVLSLLGAAPLEISEAPRAPAQPIPEATRDKLKIGS